MSGAVPSEFRARLRSGETVVGSFVNLGSPVTAEIMGVAGFEWLVIDLEHGAGDEHVLLTQLQAVTGTGAATLVRVEGLDSARVLHALDLGADGIVMPRIRSPEEARKCVQFCRYSGSRGVARYNRSWHWGLGARDPDQVDAEVVCVIQIETVRALESVREIAAIDGVDVLFVGPADLGHALGLHCPPDDPRLLDRVATVADAAREFGKAAGMLVGTPEQVLAYRDLGFTFLGCSSDSGLLALGARQLAGRLLALKQQTDIDRITQGEARPS
jgi:4-hydroxy-2-oxoheptanedioate aldolase